MNIIARAEPRYYIELLDADAKLIHSIVLKQAFSKPGQYTKAVELTASWVQYLDTRKNYRDACEAAGCNVETSHTVNATHSQLEMICLLLSRPGLMEAEVSVRVSAIRKLFAEVLATASHQFRQYEVSMVSVDL